MDRDQIIKRIEELKKEHNYYVKLLEEMDKEEEDIEEEEGEEE